MSTCHATENQHCEEHIKPTDSDGHSIEPCCPIEKSVEMWKQSFCCALKGVQVDILKEKIRQKWGPSLDKQAEAVIAAMGAHWMAMVANAKANCDLKESVKNALREVHG